MKELVYSVRVETLNHYSRNSMNCAICGESHIEFLTLDHINANAEKFNESLGIRKDYTGINLYYGLRARNYPEGFQVLCMNCNQLKGSHITSKGYNTKDRSNIINTVKLCVVCKEEKHSFLFCLDSRRRDGLASICLDCQAKVNKVRNLNTKASLINLLGNSCACCGNAKIEYLSVEHSNNDGNLHRAYIKNKYNLKKLPRGNVFAFYYLKCVKSGDVWQGLKVLCHNCNHSRAAYKYCPHEKELTSNDR